MTSLLWVLTLSTLVTPYVVEFQEAKNYCMLLLKQNIILLLIPLLNCFGYVTSYWTWYLCFPKPVIYCDNIGATHLCWNLVFHFHMKHVALDYHFILEQVQSSVLNVAHVSFEDQLIDVLTKPLPHARYFTLQAKIGLSSWRFILSRDMFILNLTFNSLN